MTVPRREGGAGAASDSSQACAHATAGAGRAPPRPLLPGQGRGLHAHATAGVGPYTAAAVASIAFGDQAAAVDGNVIRVVSRMRALKVRAQPCCQLSAWVVGFYFTPGGSTRMLHQPAPVEAPAAPHRHPQGDPTKQAKLHARLAGQLLDPERPGCHNQVRLRWLSVTGCRHGGCQACCWTQLCIHSAASPQQEVLGATVRGLRGPGLRRLLTWVGGAPGALCPVCCVLCAGDDGAGCHGVQAGEPRLRRLLRGRQLPGVPALEQLPGSWRLRRRGGRAPRHRLPRKGGARPMPPATPPTVPRPRLRSISRAALRGSRAGHRCLL